MVRISRVRASAAAGISVALAAVALAPAPASAWERPVALTPGTPGIEGPILAVNAAGDAVVAWGRGTPTTAEGGLPRAWRVEAATRPAGAAAWSAPQRLSPAGELGVGPAVAMPPSGVPVVAWTRVRRGLADVTVGEARGEASGWVTTPLDVSDGYWDTRETATAPDGTLAVATTSAWWWGRGSWVRLQVRAPGGVWWEPPLLPARVEHLAVAARPGGRALVAWLERQGDWEDPDAGTRMVAREWDPAAGWREPERGDELPEGASDLRLAVTADGSVLALVVLGRGVVATARPPGGTWTTPQILGRPGAGNVRLAVSSNGPAAAAWDDAGDTRVSMWQPGQGWSPAETTHPGVCVQPRQLESVAVGASGEVLVVGSAGGMTDVHHGYVRAWARRPDGSWVGPAWLSRPVAGSAVAAVDGSGRMHVAWSRAAGISGVPVRAEVTSTDAAGARTGVLRGDPVAAVSRVTISRRGPRSLTVRFRLSQRGRIVVQLERESPTRTLVRRLARRGQRGANAVVVRLGGREPLGRGRYVAEVWNERGVVSGCSARSRPLVIR